ncbi:hypothetical protein PanWU01x14_119480 [Parasponia andersonii]|uniref:RNase H type-1 domain-containing protein n=1 Tax=Parasponia andersonii TaxID=3476 RepID=A0A2P5CVL6_PARAD|nr:hypothetical protein PanWU01x14_119480 [Parasponia andersonii]
MTPLELSLLKLNMDATVNSSEGTIGVGALIRNDKGFVVAAIAKKRFDPYIAECLAIREGPTFAKDSLLHVNGVESDSLRAVTALGWHDIFAEESFIPDTMLSIFCSCSFIPRNRNRAAQTLTNLLYLCILLCTDLKKNTEYISHIVASY